MAVEISTEPAVREYVRTFYTERAVVSTRPTQEGNEAIDPFHQYAGVKWLVEKPVGAFDDAQWLLIQKAEEEKLLEVTVGLPKKNSNLLAECEELYLSDGVSLTAQQWNDQRKQILRDAIVSILLPSMEKEARMIMAARAKQWLAAKCGLQLWNKVSVAPFVPQKPTNTDDRFVQFWPCWASSFSPIFPLYPFSRCLLLHLSGWYLVVSFRYICLWFIAPACLFKADDVLFATKHSQQVHC